jgi:hypothetical protein
LVAGTHDVACLSVEACAPVGGYVGSAGEVDECLGGSDVGGHEDVLVRQVGDDGHGRVEEVPRTGYAHGLLAFPVAPVTAQAVDPVAGVEEAHGEYLEGDRVAARGPGGVGEGLGHALEAADEDGGRWAPVGRPAQGEFGGGGAESGGLLVAQFVHDGP